MAARGKHFCRHAGCAELVAKGQYCAKHAPLHARRFDGRKNAAERGYDARWAKFAHWYLSAPEHQFCALRISPFCKGRAECVDHIRPLTGPDDPARFDPDNLQPACLTPQARLRAQGRCGAGIAGRNCSVCIVCGKKIPA